MKFNSNKLKIMGLGVFLLVFPSGVGLADDEARIAALEEKVAVLTGELERETFSDVFVPIGESEHGMGPAASKIYQVHRGLSIGGYGEMIYQNFDDKTDTIDFLRGIVYVGYKFNDQFVLNTEIEFEHASTDENGSSSVEFAYLDYLWQEAINIRAGLLLTPVGLVNELHEPTVFYGVSRPTIENRIIPTTWRENGAGIFGDLGDFSYRIYVMNGFDATGFSASGLRGGRQKGSKAKADDFAIAGRLDYKGLNGLLVGGSFYHGNSGQDLIFMGSDVDVATTLVEAHMDWNYKGFSARALVVQADLDDVAELNRALNPGVSDAFIESIGESMAGYYLEAGYDILSQGNVNDQALTLFVRLENFDTQDKVPTGFIQTGAEDLEILVVGVHYQPLEQIVVKADQAWEEDANGVETESFNLGLGYVF